MTLQMQNAVLEVCGHQISFASSCEGAFDFLSRLDHLLGVRPYSFSATDRVPPELPALLYEDGRRFELDYDEDARRFLVCFPWGEKVPELFDQGEPFHCMLQYPIRVLLELVRQEASEYTLHASCVSKGGRSIVVTGGPESGKTTTAIDLCKRFGFDLIANDQLLVSTEDARPIAVSGDRHLNLRLSSTRRYAEQLAGEVFGRGIRAEPWNEKLIVRPSEVGISSSDLAAPVSVFARVKLDDRLDQCVVNMLSSWHDVHLDQRLLRDRFFAKIELSRALAEIIRGATFAPMEETGNRFVDVFMPSLDRKDFIEKRNRFLNALFEHPKVRVVNIRGPLELVTQKLFELFAAD